MPIETMLAIWGAILSTGLAAVKVWEIHRSRPRLTTSYSMTARAGGENKIIVENASGVPVMFSYWELELRRRKLLGHAVMNGRYPNEGYCNITIGSHARHTFIFDGQNWFPWKRTDLKGGSWYLKLHVVGKRFPIILKVYPKT